MSAIGRVTEYSIDQDDRLHSVSDSWLGFAQENAAPELTVERIVGRVLWEFVDGPEIRQIYRALIDRVRAQKQPTSLPFRCDSPECARFMTLQIAPGDKDEVHFTARLDREVQREPIPAIDSAIPRSSQSVPICSFCKAIRYENGEWVDLERAARELRLVAQSPPPTLTHGLCGDCSRQLKDDVPRDSA